MIKYSQSYFFFKEVTIENLRPFQESDTDDAYIIVKEVCTNVVY